MTQFAVIATGGKQYLVTPGQTLEVEKLPYDEGKAVTFDQVLLSGSTDGSVVTVGTPTVAGASVKATVVKQSRSRKVIVRKFKAKVRYTRTYGHRQPFTQLLVTDINAK